MLPVALYAKIVNDWFRDISTHTPLAGRDRNILGNMAVTLYILGRTLLFCAFCRRFLLVSCNFCAKSQANPSQKSHHGRFTSDDYHALGVIPALCADMLDLFVPIVAEIVKPQAVELLIDYLHELVFELHELAVIEVGLENRVLHPLCTALALFCDEPQPLSTGGTLRTHIIAYQNHHGSHLLI